MKVFKVFNSENKKYLSYKVKGNLIYSNRGKIFTNERSLKERLKRLFIVDIPKQGIYENNIPESLEILNYNYGILTISKAKYLFPLEKYV